jgi:hypothetical protein
MVLYIVTVFVEPDVVYVLDAMFPFALMGVTIAIGISVLKYRLYDIDVIINRTLVYVPLTAILAGLYIASAGFFRVVLTRVTGASSEVAVALSTLGIVALLTPIKNQLQALVDRYFKAAPEPGKSLKKLIAETDSVLKVLDTDLFLRQFLQNATVALDAQGSAVQLNGATQRVVAHGDWNGNAGMKVSLTHHGRSLGMLHLGPHRSGRAFTSKEVKVVEDCAKVLAHVLSVTDKR